MSSSNSGTSTTDEDDLVSLYDDPAANSVENKIEMLPTEEEVEDVLIAGSEKAIDIRCHKYRAHKVSGPSTYYFGIIDILQKWSIKKQVERVYKIQLLRKDGRGLSAIHPTIYAARFQQKMAQLFSQRVVEIEIPASGSAVDQ
jgi:hypothetical protein